MTQAARQVLADCEAALQDFDGSTGMPWRTRWVAVITLLRAVGHVLHKVDSCTSPALARAIAAEHEAVTATKPEPAIFWGFIEEGRNSLLKQYTFGVQQNVTVRPGAAWLDLRTGESGGTPSGPTTYDQLMRDGPFAGQDPCRVVEQAIEWWRQYLARVERRAASTKVP